MVTMVLGDAMRCDLLALIVRSSGGLNGGEAPFRATQKFNI